MVGTTRAFSLVGRKVLSVKKEETMINDVRWTTAFPAVVFFTLLSGSPALASDADRKQAQANFQKADANKDEQLDTAEFKTFINLNADHGLGRASTIRRFGAYGRAFGTLDSNNDGAVSREEIAKQAQR